ncbi:Na/Pi symporter [Alkalihalobacillus sp. LMS39]|uniref:Na/Pi symporter n=1 Tax=Alkalihalobacillus sp. LMS39 TaxID=2924032 RepID=UPI001FB35D05|nr:Na/Pi symporter [Alkalihalobacillus sp. LMS39]UOE95647.1 Na/Pi symporter [Alkalihalobacillus sp. LMS39]
MTKEILSLLAVFISIFLFGMIIMRFGLLNLGEERVRQVLHKMTSAPWKGLLAGTLITAVIQSSSALMVIVVGLVAARFITFRHSIGLILGANIGTCLTLELIAIDLSSYILPMLFLGLILLLIPKAITYSLGCVCFGLACIFVAMDGLETLAYPLATIPIFHSFFEITNEVYILGVAIGTVLTAIIQSSTATTAIAMGFLNEDVLSLSSSVAIMLGANIGTCVTAYLASLGAGREAKLVAYANIWLNVIGVLLFLPLIGLLSAVASSLADLPSLQLAHASMIFNIVCSLLFFPFISLFAKFITAVHGRHL